MCVETLTGVLFWSFDLLGKPFSCGLFSIWDLVRSSIIIITFYQSKSGLFIGNAAHFYYSPDYYYSYYRFLRSFSIARRTTRSSPSFEPTTVPRSFVFCVFRLTATVSRSKNNSDVPSKRYACILSMCILVWNASSSIGQCTLAWEYLSWWKGGKLRGPWDLQKLEHGLESKRARSGAGCTGFSSSSFWTGQEP